MVLWISSSSSLFGTKRAVIAALEDAYRWYKKSLEKRVTAHNGCDPPIQKKRAFRTYDLSDLCVGVGMADNG